MSAEKEKLCEHRVFYHFSQICRIPHGSRNEKALSDFILHWARGLGLEAEQDAVHNVLIRKPASPGFETAPAVMLQAHMDMVCEKAEGVAHDFARDPIDWVIEGDTLSTGGKTTLGADDGIGAALAMAILEDGTLRHPLLEALFTVGEEEDFEGANGFDAAAMQASCLINLDNTDERVIVCGSCGGMQAELELPLAREPVPSGWDALRLHVSGLRGGHSGEDIHRGRGNANILLARMLLALRQCGDFRLAQIRGGSFRLAIPREAEAVVWMDRALLPSARERLAALEADFRAELAVTGGGVSAAAEPAQAPPYGARPEPVLAAMTLIPDGIYQMNEALSGLVDASDNLGEVYLDESGLRLVLEIRSARSSLGEYLFQRMEQLAGLLGGSCRKSRPYPGWAFQPGSRLRGLYARTYRALYGEEPALLTVHAGLEVGCFFGRRADLDAISVGPDCWDFHSPAESLRISSVKRVYQCLCEVLAAMEPSGGMAGGRAF